MAIDDATKNIQQNINFVKQQNSIIKNNLSDNTNLSNLDSKKYYYLSNTRMYFIYVKSFLNLVYFILFVILVAKVAFSNKPASIKVAIVAAFIILPFLFKYLIPILQWVWNFIGGVMNKFLGRVTPNMESTSYTNAVKVH